MSEQNKVYCEATGKVSYTSKHTALQALTGQLKSKAIRVYPCNECHMFHVTKSIKTRTRGERKRATDRPRQKRWKNGE